MKHVLKAGLAGLVMLAAPIADAQKKAPPAEWDGLHKVESKKFDVASRYVMLWRTLAGRRTPVRKRNRLRCVAAVAVSVFMKRNPPRFAMPN